MAAYAGELEEEEQSGSLCARGVCEAEVAMQGGLMFCKEDLLSIGARAGVKRAHGSNVR